MHMTTKITVGITRDFFDAEGNFDLPGPGLELFDEMPGIQYRILAERTPRRKSPPSKCAAATRSSRPDRAGASAP